MQEIILIKNGELALKGLNRATFESVLVKNIKRRLRDLGHFVINRSQSTITIEPTGSDFDTDEAVERLRRVFGIAAFHSPASGFIFHGRSFIRCLLILHLFSSGGILTAFLDRFAAAGSGRRSVY